MTVEKVYLPAVFGQAQLDIFKIEDFQERMSRLRVDITPRLFTLGELLLEPLSKVVREPLYLHVARHLRRTVNPPVATWAAFARTQRAYKPTVHIRTAVSRDGVHTNIFVEDYAEDRPLFARQLMDRADEMAKYFSGHPSIKAFTITDAADRPLAGEGLTADVLREFAMKLQTSRTQHSVFGLKVAPSALSDTEALCNNVMRNVKTLLPIYRLGMERR